MGKRKQFPTEAMLFEALSPYAEKRGWEQHAEIRGGGPDMILRAKPGCTTRGARPGDQILVQGKLKSNMALVRQLLPQKNAKKGPHYRAALVEQATSDFLAVANWHQWLVFEGTYIAAGADPLVSLPTNYRAEPPGTLWLPDVEIRAPAGEPSPRSISPWLYYGVIGQLEAQARGGWTSTELWKEFEKYIHLRQFVSMRWARRIKSGEPHYKQGETRYYMMQGVGPVACATPDVLRQIEEKALAARAGRPAQTTTAVREVEPTTPTRKPLIATPKHLVAGGNEDDAVPSKQ